MKEFIPKYKTWLVLKWMAFICILSKGSCLIITLCLYMWSVWYITCLLFYLSQAGKHVSQIAVGGPAPSRKESVPSRKESIPSASAFGGDERHFNLAVINGESTEVKRPVNGGNIEDELGPEFGKATLSKSAPVADIVVQHCLITLMDFNMNRRLYFFKYSGPTVAKI